MGLPRSPQVALLTVTFARDIEAFRLLRKSLESVDCNFPHYIVVDEEDRRLFDEFKSNLTAIRTTADVLPGWIEKARKRRSYRRRDIRYWVNGRAISGWWCQQIAKLSAPAIANEETAVAVVDSETVFLAPLTPDLFLSSDGESRLFVAPPCSSPAFHYTWAMKSLPLLRLHAGHYLQDFITWPQVFDIQCLRELHKYLEKCYSKPWQESIVQYGALEYPTYGLYRTHLWQGSTGSKNTTVARWMATFTNLNKLEDPVKAIKDGIRKPGIQAFVANSFNGVRTDSIESIWRQYMDESPVHHQ